MWILGMVAEIAYAQRVSAIPGFGRQEGGGGADLLLPHLFTSWPAEGITFIKVGRADLNLPATIAIFIPLLRT